MPWIRFGLLGLGFCLTACARSADSIRLDEVRPIFGRWRESLHGSAQFHLVRMENRRVMVDGRPAKLRGNELSFALTARHAYSGMLNRDYKVIVNHSLSLESPTLLVGERIVSIPQPVPSPGDGLPAYPAGTIRRVPIKWEKIELTPPPEAAYDPLIGTWEGDYTDGAFRKSMVLIITLEQGVYKVNGYPAQRLQNTLKWSVEDAEFEQTWQLAFERPNRLTGSFEKTVLPKRETNWGKAVFRKKSDRTWAD